MSDLEFRALLDLMVVSDPFPTDVNRDVIENLLDREAIARGHTNWVDAYHCQLPERSI